MGPDIEFVGEPQKNVEPMQPNCRGCLIGLPEVPELVLSRWTSGYVEVLGFHNEGCLRKWLGVDEPVPTEKQVQKAVDRYVNDNTVTDVLPCPLHYPHCRGIELTYVETREELIEKP